MTYIHFWCIFDVLNHMHNKIKTMKKQITYAVFFESQRATVITPYPMSKKKSYEFFKEFFARYGETLKMSQVYRYN